MNAHVRPIKPRFIQGAKGGGKKGGSSGGNEDPNTLRSKAILKVIDLLGEGEIVGLVDGAKSIYLDQTPLQNADGTYNFKGVTFATRDGLPDQAYINGFGDVESEVSVGVKVNHSNPVIREINNPDLDALRVTIRLPTMTRLDKEGNLHGNTVKFRIEVRHAAGTWVNYNGDITITGKCTSAYDTQYTIPLPQNPNGNSYPWQVRVTRITADSTETKSQNDVYFSAYTEITDTKFSYPNSAYIAMQIDSEEFGSNVPARAYKVRGRIVQVPVNYNAETREYAGIWNGAFKEAYTNNPAWILYDVLRNDRFGLGEYIDPDQIDKWSLYEVAKYCDELVPDGYGGMEPRFTYNAYITTQKEAFDAVQGICSNFRGMAYWSSGMVMVAQDRPGEIEMLVSPSNVIGGEFNRTSTGLKGRHTVAVVEWNDPDDFYRSSREVVMDNAGVRRYGRRQTDVKAEGVTSRGQANRYGRWTTATEILETQTISYKAGLDHSGIRPGDQIAVQDPSIASIDYAGRIAAVNKAAIGAELDFVRQKFSQNGDNKLIGFFPFTRSTPGMAQDSAGNWFSFAENVRRIVDTGMVYEAAATNYITRSLPTGTIGLFVPSYDNWILNTTAWNDTGTWNDGAIWFDENKGSGSILGWNFATSFSGLYRELVGFGTESGLPYVDIRYAGVATSAAPLIANFEDPLNIATARDEAWCSSIFMTLVAGSLDNVALALSIAGFTSAGADNGDSTSVNVYPAEGSLSASRTRLVRSIAKVDTTRVTSQLRITPTNGAAIDFTLRLSLPQLEKGVAPSTPIKTTGLVLTRPADQLTLALEPDTYNITVTFPDGTGQLFAEQVVDTGTWALPQTLLATTVKSVTAVSSSGRNIIKSIQLDHDVTFNAGRTYTLSVVMPSGKVEEQTIQPSVFDKAVRSVTTTSTFLETPEFAANWMISASNLVPERYRVITIKEDEPHVYDVTAVQSEPAKYDHVDRLAPFAPLQTALYPSGPIPQPTNLTIVEYLAPFGNSMTNAVTISGQAPNDARIRQYEWQHRGRDFETGETPDWPNNSTFTNFPSVDILSLEMGLHDFRVRSVSSLGSTSTWLELSNVDLSALYQPPPTPYDLRTSILGDNLRLMWSIDNMDNVASFEVRHSPLTNGVTWNSATIIANGMRDPTAQLPTVKGTFLVKALSYAGIYSNDAAVLISSVESSATMNVVEDLLESPTFAGTRTNVAVIGGDLMLGTGSMMSNWGTLSTLGDMLFASNDAFVPEGMYEFAELIDLGQPYTSRLSSVFEVYGFDFGNVIDDWANLYDLEAMDTTSSDSWGAKFEYQITTQDPSVPEGWSSWMPFQLGDVYARAFRFRVRLYSYSPRVSPRVRTLSVRIDMPDRVVAGNDISVEETGKKVSFDLPFRKLMGLGIADQDLLSGDHHLITDKDETGFFIRYFNAAGVPVARTFDYVAKGYGVAA